MNQRRFRITPTNQKDKLKFMKQANTGKEAILDEVERLYDGTRTMAQCWKLALSSCDNNG